MFGLDSYLSLSVVLGIQLYLIIMSILGDRAKDLNSSTARNFR